MFFNALRERPSKPRVRPLEEQDERESIKLWQKTAQAVKESNHLLATELVHRLVKQHYARTNRRDHEAQIIKMDVLQRVHERMTTELDEAEADAREQAKKDADDEDEAEKEKTAGVDALSQPYRIAKEQAHPIDLYEWIEDLERRNDAAYTVRFRPTDSYHHHDADTNALGRTSFPS